jgi:hypothetical protein
MRDFVNELWDGYSFDWEATENHARREVEWATQRGELELARNWGMVLEAVCKARSGRVIV